MWAKNTRPGNTASLQRGAVSLLLGELFDTDLGTKREENAETTELDTLSDPQTACPADALRTASGQSASQPSLRGASLRSLPRPQAAEHPGGRPRPPASSPFC